MSSFPGIAFATMDERADDKQLWSWVDRDAAELEVYLDRHPDERGRVERLRAELRGLQTLAAPGTATPDFIGPYRVTGVLGAGGMGVVYAALQKSPRREVAVKVMRDRGIGGGSLPARFAREVEALGRLQHRAIATIHEAGTTAEGVPYLVMERVQGLPLTAWAARQRASRRRRLEVVAAIADAVEAAHRSGVAHRDLKPGNILVDDSGNPKLLDFGLARLVGDSATADLTQPGTFAGTLGYLAPERLANDALATGRDDDGRQVSADDIGADVYALGVLLFELVAGRLPHPVAGVSLAGLIDSVCRGPTPLLGDAAAGVDAALEQIAAKALARDPRDRYAAAADLADDLRRYLAGEAVAAPPIRTRRAARRWRRLRPLAGIVLVGLAAALAAALAVWAGTAGRRGPNLAPYPALQWAGDRPEVWIDGDWMQLRRIDGIAVDDIVAFCKERYDRLWRKRFGEDLPSVMRQFGRPLGRSVDLNIAALDGGGSRDIDDVPLTESNRTAIRAAGVVIVDDELRAAANLRAAFDPRADYPARAPFVATRLRDGRLEVMLTPESEFREWLAIGTMPVSRLRRICRRAFGADWLKRIGEDLVQVLALLGEDPGDRVDLTLGGAGGTPQTIRGVTMSEANRRLVNQANR